MSAAKWIREGEEPYPHADDDARAVDTRIGTPSVTGSRFDRAIRARGRDAALLGLIVRHLAGGLADASLWGAIDAAAAELDAIEHATRAIARRYKVVDLEKREGMPAKIRSLAFVNASPEHGKYDKTLLLLMGQERAGVAVLLDTDNVSFAAAFDSGISFLGLFGLSGGMPTLVSMPKERARGSLARLGVREGDLELLLG
jgi:hypothetical protein